MSKTIEARRLTCACFVIVSLLGTGLCGCSSSPKDESPPISKGQPGDKVPVPLGTTGKSSPGEGSKKAD